MYTRLSRFNPRGIARRLSGLALALSVALLAATDAAAQATGTVTGVVRDVVSRQPVGSAQISVEGTGLGGLSNNVGRFLILNVPAGERTLRAQLIGYGTVEHAVTVPAGGSATADFDVRQEALSLEGVVVTGTAGQARRREVGNAISQIGARDIELAAVTTTADLLQGRAAGVQVNAHAGQVGTGAQIRLRGNNSLLAEGNYPLIYVDGVRIRSRPIGADDEAGSTPSVLDMVNPNDIDRIEIVKGPAATTLYGTEAAGGVIQIFTKRSSAGAPVWTASIDQGFSDLGHIGGALNPKSINPTGLGLNDCSGSPGCPSGGSWLRTGHIQRYDLSVRGGTETSRYFVSGRWSDSEGVIAPQGAEDYGLRANVSFQPSDGLDITLTNSYSRRNIAWIPDGNNAGGFLLNVMRGSAGYTPNNDDSLILNNQLDSEIDNLVLGASVSWTPSSTWTHRVNTGMDYTSSDFTDFKPWGESFDAVEGSREDDQRRYRNLTLDYSGSFSQSPFEAISSRTAWGGQLYERFRHTINGFDDTFAGPGDALIGDGTNKDADEDRETIRSGGFFLEEMLGWRDKWFVTGGVRWDGFSTFGEGFGLATYPKLSTSYLLSEESFWPSGIVETLKLRAAWGKSGKAPDAFDADLIFEATAADEEVPGVVIENLGNPDLGPEKSSEFEWGFEASAFNGRLFVDFTKYNQTTRDALIAVQEAPSFGTEEATLTNLGETKNWGTETSLNVVPVRTGAVEWALGVNYSTNDSEITDLGPLEELGSSLQLGLPVRIRWDDIIQNPDAVGELPEYEKGMIGRLFPKKLVGLSTRLSLWRSVTLDVVGEGQYGHVRPSGPAYQNMRRTSAANPAWPYCVPIIEQFNAGGEQRASLTALQVGRCIQRHSDQGVWTGKANFFKLRSATLSFRLPDAWVPRAQSAMIALQAKNLFTVTDYFGLDPEAQDNGFGDATPNEYYTLPPPRTFMFNLRVTF